MALAPCLEGIGLYPLTTRELRASPYPVWVAGDAAGTFRGLTASMVSGYFAGLRASCYTRSRYGPI